MDNTVKEANLDRKLYINNLGGILGGIGGILGGTLWIIIACFSNDAFWEAILTITFALVVSCVLFFLVKNYPDRTLAIASGVCYLIVIFNSIFVNYCFLSSGHLSQVVSGEFQDFPAFFYLNIIVVAFAVPTLLLYLDIRKTTRQAAKAEKYE